MHIARWMGAALFVSVISHATTVYPETAKDPVLNLERYLERLFDGEMDFRCAPEAQSVRCIEKDFAKTEKDENNATVRTRFDRLELRFGRAILPYFEKRAFDAAMEEYEAAENAKKAARAKESKAQVSVPTPLKDAMDKAMWRELKRVELRNLRVDVSRPAAHTAVGEILYENALRPDEGNVTYGEPIFGTLSLRYRDFTARSEERNGSAYTALTRKIEHWLDTNDTARADYVGKKLQTLYAKRTESPGSGSLTLTTAYGGNDNLTLKIRAEGKNAQGDSSRFAFDGEVRRLSALFPPAGDAGQAQGGMPDFLFRSLDLESHIHNDPYRRLIHDDPTFRRYMRQYETLIGKRYDEAVETYSGTPVVSGWFKAAKQAFSKIIRGEADRFGLHIKNRTGATAMQLVGAVIGQLAIMGERATDAQKEKIILDTAAQHLDIRIEAK